MKNIKTYTIQMFSFLKGSAISLQSISFLANRVLEAILENSYGEVHIVDKVTQWSKP